MPTCLIIRIIGAQAAGAANVRGIFEAEARLVPVAAVHCRP